MERNEYEIIKFRKDRPPKRQPNYGSLTLEQARRICSDPTTKGKDWFLGFSKIGNY